MHNKFLNHPDLKIRKLSIENIGCITRMISSDEINLTYKTLKEKERFGKEKINFPKYKKKNIDLMKFHNLDTISKYKALLNELNK